MTSVLTTNTDPTVFPLNFLGDHDPSKKMYLTSEEREALEKKYNVTTETLLKNIVKNICTVAMPPVSNFYVGVAGLGKSGNVYFGINLEFPHLQINQTVHGEQFMICNAYSHNEPGIVMIAVNAAPCGHCRQFLNELETPFKVKICIVNLNINETLADLLPYSFGPRDLGSNINLLGKMNNKLTFRKNSNGNHNSTSGSNNNSINDNPTIQAALVAANRSYSPYTNSPSGVAILSKTNNNIYIGSYLENAAFNPSLQPFQAALIHMISSGNRNDFKSEIVEVVLVEKKSNKIKQSEGTQMLLKELSPNASFTCIELD
eukprot:g1398.t1